MKIRVDFEFFREPVGTIYELIENTYELNVCDCCGKKRKCDYYSSEHAYLDLCRTCRKEHAEVVE